MMRVTKQTQGDRHESYTYCPEDSKKKRKISGCFTKIPKLFDFNLIPFHERPGISMSKLLLKLGLTNEANRDKRLLRNFDKIARREKKLVKYFE